jgi:glutamyl/glutaminyl-tRNA synthetase
MTSPRLFRWAPTPSGALHLGNVFSFVLTWILARENEAKILLRIDDLDATRSRKEFVVDIFQVLEGLGLEWQKGPQSVTEFEKRWSQISHQKYYLERFEELRQARPSDFYLCECSRSEIASQSKTGFYPGTCRQKALAWREGVVWRCRVPESHPIDWDDKVLGHTRIDLAQSIGDFVVYRKDRLFSYQWVSLCEDLRHGVTDIVRGEDLLASTAAQLFLGRDTAFEACAFWHHPLLVGENGKISKSEGAASVSQILKSPEGRRKILTAFARWCGWDHWQDVCVLDDLLEAYKHSPKGGCLGQISRLDELL